MNYKFIALTIITILLASCSQSPDVNLISKHSIGLLTDSTQIKDLQLVFPNDSIVKLSESNEFTNTINDIEIYENSGKKLLTLTPKKTFDSTSTIKSIQIHGEHFKTAKGLNSKSTFKSIKDNYKISSIQNTLKNIMVSVNEINAFFTIDKDELPAELRFDMNLKIEAIQIPDEAKIKGFYMQWY
ncbi:MAG: hypothetical protein R2816_09485 [Flavobacteriaceae bacterium]|nr:hypothetical protein [Flavobacteriaceae bacterium]